MSSIRWSTARLSSPVSARELPAAEIPRSRAHTDPTATAIVRRPIRLLMGPLDTQVPPEGEPRGEHGERDDTADHPRRDRHDIGHADEGRVDEGATEVA